MKLKNMVAPVVFGALGLAVANANAGTAAGIEITNTASLNYDVNGQNQSITSEAKVDVDLKLDFALTTNNNAILTTSLPDAATEINIANLKLQNDSNAPVTYVINIVDKAEDQKATLYGSSDETTDTFDLTSPTFTVSATNGANVTVAGSQITITKLAKEGDTDITVNANKASFQGELNGTSLSIFDFTAEATAAFDDSDASIDVSANSTAGKDADLATVQVVYADDGQNNNESVSEGLSLTLPYFPTDPTDPTDPATNGLIKKNDVVWDPINGTTNPKAIPGAVIKYTLEVRNQGNAAAEDLVVKDDIPVNTKYCSGVQGDPLGINYNCANPAPAADPAPGAPVTDAIGSTPAFQYVTVATDIAGTTFTPVDATRGAVLVHYPSFAAKPAADDALENIITFYVTVD